MRGEHPIASARLPSYYVVMRDNKISRTGEPASATFKSPAVYRILVAEDEPLIRQLNTEALTGSGYEVDAVEDGSAAWQALNLNSYDLLITDHNMPNLTGLQLVKKLHSSRMALPVIMATGTLPEEELARHPWLKPAALLLKPYTITELLGAVKEVLREEEDPAIADQSMFSDSQNQNPPQAEKPTGTPRPHPTRSAHRILVVDDNSDTRQLSVDALTDSGYDVDAAIDGAAGWEALQDTSYDLAITDNKMPRMTGVEMIEKVRAARMAIPVIMATGHLPTQEFARKPWLKPDAELQRPFSNDELLAAVKKVLLLDDGSDGNTQTLLPKYL